VLLPWLELVALGLPRAQFEAHLVHFEGISGGKSMTLGYLATHPATIPGFLGRLATQDGFGAANFTCPWRIADFALRRHDSLPFLMEC